MMLQAGQLTTVQIEKPAAGGRMIARVEGQVVLVAGVIPGETAAVRVERTSKGVAYARAVEILTPSSDRRDAFDDPLCGGCVYSHIAYDRQRQIKAEVIADAFARIGRMPLPAAVAVAASREDGYRMRARLHVRGARVGFFREGTHEICDARATRQLRADTCAAIDRLAAGVRSLGASGCEIDLSENVDASERVVQFETPPGGDSRALRALAATDGFTPGPFVTDELPIGGDRPMRLRRHVLTFFQGNRYLLADLVAHVVAQVPRGDAVVDLYAGAGVFSIAAAAARGARVTAVEGDRYAAEDLAANARASGAEVTPVRQPVEDWARLAGPAMRAALGTLIVDPPRTGMSREAMEGMAALRAPRVVYVSCDIATLARDARRLADAGYRLERVDAFDMFPNTPHVETVVVFTR
jgi:23S rRNA (uracil1939-C5)-methyltransferase